MAFAGRSNVGKSTLVNRLCQRKGLARTSRTPGCTRGVVLFDVGLRSGEGFVLADLPGYGFAERSKSEKVGWGTLIEQYLQRRASLAGVVILVDGRRGLEPEEHQLMDYLRHIHRRFVVAVTKVDKLGRGERPGIIARIAKESGAPAVGVSGETGEGREDLLRRVLGLVRFEGAGSAQGGTASEPSVD